MADKAKHYYEIALALPAMWKQHIYTYASDEKLATGAVVTVPFGAADKVGYVTAAAKKPTFKTKPVSSVTPFCLPEKTIKLLDWLVRYYPSAPGMHVQHAIPAFVKNMKALEPEPATATPGKRPDMTKQQASVFHELTADSSPASAVVYGITGSGKTRLYAELAAHYQAQGKDVLILYPEISLTSQLRSELGSYLGKDSLHTYHSKRTPTEQKKTWQAAHNTTGGQVFLGPRSALFLPYANLGAVIIDEAHDGAYKQDSGTRYNGLIVAAALATQHKAKLVLGSATPPIQETQQILSKGGQLLTMNQLAKNDTPTDKSYQVVDMTKKENRSASYLLSKPLVQAMSDGLKEGKQTLLFLNRRGTARMLLCEDCGWHAECPRCDSPLTYHHDGFALQCHICGYSQKAMTSCPDCSSTLTQKTPGVKAIEQDIKKLFPSAKVGRFDSDNKKQDSFAENYKGIKKGNVDIILGTQLITKGLDLPLLSTVGILQADSALLMPDYTSEERAFQQLTQVSGRVGRGHTKGHVIIQTYQPENQLFSDVIAQDWRKFYEQELTKRKTAGFPPFSYAMKIWIAKPTSEAAEKAITKLHKSLQDDKRVRMLGPAPSFYEKNAGKYIWQLVLLSPSRAALADIAADAPKDFLYDLDPVSLL